MPPASAERVEVEQIQTGEQVRLGPLAAAFAWIAAHDAPHAAPPAPVPTDSAGRPVNVASEDGVE
jgi:hypothetical protein